MQWIMNNHKQFAATDSTARATSAGPVQRWLVATVLAMTLAGLSSMVHAQLATSPLFAGNQRHVKVIDQGDDAGATVIDGAARRVDLKPIAIKGNERYHLTIEARLDSDFVVEDNDRAHHLVLESHNYARTSTYQLIFHDAENKEISTFGYSKRGFFLTKNWHAYHTSFYTPVEAVSLVIRIQPSSHATLLRSVQVKVQEDRSTVNLAPDFRHGELNYKGWNPSRDGRLFTRPDGVTIFKPGYGGTSDVFPLDPTATYRASAQGLGERINLVYYNESGKQLHTRHLTSATAKGDRFVEFIPPEGTRWGRILMYRVDSLEALRIEKVTDKQP